MNYDYILPARADRVQPFHTALGAFPIACFSLTLLTDLAYVGSLNLLWLHFSEWLLLAGLVFGVLAAIVRLVDLIFWQRRPPWLAVVGGVVVMLLATLNSFIHTADGWTAVMPYGLTVSVITVLAMIATGWFASTEVRHV
ncbi:DUF2231 domain-containing protein [Stappia indica]|uniref:Uncharacterized membrane protein n=1 Tax=Stappia indica TaxID=538381 RepID=A0A285TVR2_9HYPH|nr:DUF2231 domain-containing protein [Stappia indica]SOC25948.1 Uncharacterized membrane protein [Stappia indica]